MSAEGFVITNLTQVVGVTMMGSSIKSYKIPRHEHKWE